MYIGQMIDCNHVVRVGHHVMKWSMKKIRKLLSRLLVDTLCILIRTIVICLIIVAKMDECLTKMDVRREN